MRGNNVRRKLIQVRTAKHWTQLQVAVRVGVDSGTYRRWERGTATPRPSNLQRLCEALGRSDEELDFYF